MYTLIYSCLKIFWDWLFSFANTISTLFSKKRINYIANNAILIEFSLGSKYILEPTRKFLYLQENYKHSMWKLVITTLQWSSSFCLILCIFDWMGNGLNYWEVTSCPEYHQKSMWGDWIQAAVQVFAEGLLCVKSRVLCYIPLILKRYMIHFGSIQLRFICPLLCIGLSARSHGQKVIFPGEFCHLCWIQYSESASLRKQWLISQSSWER